MAGVYVPTRRLEPLAQQQRILARLLLSSRLVHMTLATSSLVVAGRAREACPDVYIRPTISTTLRHSGEGKICRSIACTSVCILLCSSLRAWSSQFFLVPDDDFHSPGLADISYQHPGDRTTGWHRLTKACLFTVFLPFCNVLLFLLYVLTASAVASGVGVVISLSISTAELASLGGNSSTLCSSFACQSYPLWPRKHTISPAFFFFLPLCFFWKHRSSWTQNQTKTASAFVALSHHRPPSLPKCACKLV